MIRAAAAAASRACSLKFSVSTPIDFTWDTTLNGGAGAWPTTPTSDTRFVYDGWNVILELDALNSNAVQRKFTWGLDLSGTRQGAGGIGGLLAVEDASGTPTNSADDPKYLYFHDANGNVGQLIDWRPIADWQSLGLSSANDWHASRLVARYEYDAYGNSLLDPANAGVSGAYAAANPFRFSTKYCEGDLDASTTNDDLYYYGYRYYRPDVGRWVSRDPRTEKGDNGLFRFLRNAPQQFIDPTGRTPLSASPSSQPTTMPTASSSKTPWNIKVGGSCEFRDKTPNTFTNIKAMAAKACSCAEKVAKFFSNPNTPRNAAQTSANTYPLGLWATGNHTADELNELSQRLSEAFQGTRDQCEDGVFIECPCNCKEGVVAFKNGGALGMAEFVVYGAPVINLCPVFFHEKRGYETLLHELTHVGAGSDDDSDPSDILNLAKNAHNLEQIGKSICNIADGYIGASSGG